MIVREYVENPEAGQSIREGRISAPMNALGIYWVKKLGGKWIWEPDDEGYGFVISYAGEIVAILLRERGER